MLTDQHLSIVAELGFHRDQIIGMGMQALVLDADDEIVKIYLHSSPLPDLPRLQAFYASLDASTVSYTVPSIIEIKTHASHTIVREAKISGRSLNADALNALDKAQVQKYITGYVDALFAVRRIKTAFLAEGELVTPIVVGTHFGDWHNLLREHIEDKWKTDFDFLPTDVTDWSIKSDLLQRLFSQPYTGEAALIHGDFFPGNLMVDDDLNVTALVDFGTMTTHGDALWDVITGWAFIDMYNEVENHDLKGMVMAHLTERLTSAELSLAYSYLMVFSLITSNLYAPNDRDGHYWWCAGNLNNEAMWDSIRQTEA